MGAHSILPPSGAKAWRRCALWVTMNRLYPQPDTPESLQGTAAHWVFAEMLDGRQVLEGAIGPKGVFITDEMLDGAELYVEAIRARVPANVDLHVEEPVHISRIHSECWGTPDTWAYIADTRTLKLFDYKFGHMFVDEFENEQGLAYATGIIDRLYPMIGAGPVTVEFTIIQPRCYYGGSPVRTWVFVLDYGADPHPISVELSCAAVAALGPDPIATTNDECIHCPGRHACAALQKSAYRSAELSVKSAPVDLAPEAASLELRILERALERLEARVDGLRESVTAHVRSGAPVPFHRVEQKAGRPQWNLPPAQVIAMGELMGVDLAKVGVVTPNQAIKSGIDEAVIKAYSTQPMGALKLVPVNPDDARRVFNSNN